MTASPSYKPRTGAYLNPLMNDPRQTILAIYPNPRGFGYALVEMPKFIIDHGIVKPYPLSNGTLLKRAERIIDYYRPHVIILRSRESLNADYSRRTRKLLDAIETLAGEKNISVYSYARENIKDVFALFGARTKHEIASHLVARFPEANLPIPKLRKPWQDEDYSMGMFDALSLIITHSYINE